MSLNPGYSGFEKDTGGEPGLEPGYGRRSRNNTGKKRRRGAKPHKVVKTGMRRRAETVPNTPRSERKSAESAEKCRK